ncbi:MAG: tripartite tricarboxylate transporter substrate binding protein [Betaproteobacteria bacterium]|nr:MAG: tripartite tricarboxylate transporter substrate binding protein [Betaproteobacteria bacterium]
MPTPFKRAAAPWAQLILGAVALVLGTASAAAQGWTPSKTIEIVVPSAPGGSNDKTARAIERILQTNKLVPTAVVVVNKPGAGNMMTMNYIAQHNADAHYLMIGTPTILTGHIVGTNKLTYGDFTPIASLLKDYVVFAVRNESSLKTGSELVERLKKDPKSVSVGFATALGSHNHIAAGLLMKAIGGDVRAMKVLAFKGSSEAVTAVLGGHIDLVTTAAGNAARHVEAGKMRILGIAAERRMPGVLASVPTWKEQGVPIVFGGWRSIMGPKGMTAAQVGYWENVLKQVTATPEWKADLQRNFWAEDVAYGANFADELKQEYAAMKSVLTELGLAKQ